MRRKILRSNYRVYRRRELIELIKGKAGLPPGKKTYGVLTKEQLVHLIVKMEELEQNADSKKE